jgi:hypothetical protein
MLYTNDFFQKISEKWRITFRLFTTLPAPYKAMRSIAGAGNVPE